MSRAEITLLPDVKRQLDRLVEGGEFADQREAIEELLTLGVREQEASTRSDSGGDLDFADEMLENGDEHVY